MRRALGAVLAVVLGAAAVFALVSFLNARDDSGLEGPATGGPGVVASDETAPELARGNVLLTYARPEDRAPLEALAGDLGGDAAELRAEGFAVLVRRQGDGVVGHAFRRRIEVATPQDPALRAFAETWLGRGDGSGPRG